MKAKEWYACGRKRKYLKGEAYHIADMRNTYKGGAGTAYECEYCGYWHITKRPKQWPLDKFKEKK